MIWVKKRNVGLVPLENKIKILEGAVCCLMTPTLAKRLGPWVPHRDNCRHRDHDPEMMQVRGFPGVRSLGREDPLEKEMVTHSSIFAWRIAWTEEPGKLQSMGSKESDMTEGLHLTSLHSSW